MRATTLLPQIERERRFSSPAARDATLLLVWGFFKKLVIADNVGVIANKVFALQSPGVLRALGRGVRVRHPDLRRLLRVHGHRARRGEVVRHRSHQELRAPVPREGPDRVLAALEHLAVDVVPRLRVPAGGVPDLATGSSSDRRVLLRCHDVGVRRRDDRDHADGRALARRQLELRDLGRLSRRAAGPRAHRRRRAETAAPGAPVARAVPQIAGMFLLTNVGWLFFRETDLAATRSGTSACRRSSRPRSAGRPAPTCSSSPCCIHSRCGSRASGRKRAGATSWRP